MTRKLLTLAEVADILVGALERGEAEELAHPGRRAKIDALRRDLAELETKAASTRKRADYAHVRTARAELQRVVEQGEI